MLLGDEAAEQQLPRRTAVKWTTKYVNDLPDSAFLYIEPGGTKDRDGKTVPRRLRHFPYKDQNGAIDVAHLRNAIARIPQSDLPADVKERVQKRARRLLIEYYEKHGQKEAAERAKKRFNEAHKGFAALRTLAKALHRFAE